MIATASAASPRSCATARTACSSRPATSRRWPRRSGASSPTPSCASASARARRPPSVERLRARAGLRPAGGDPPRGGADEAARPLRRPDALPAAARARLARKLDALAERARRARARERRDGRAATTRFRSCRRAARSTGRSSTRAAVPRRARAARRSDPTPCSSRARTRRGGAARAPRSRAPREGVLEVHGDWRTATRLYGSPARARARARSPTASRAGRCAAPTRVRTVSDYTTGARPRARASSRRRSSPPSWISSRSSRPPVPLPERAAALFVGVLERYKDVDVLADGVARWSRRGVPDAELHDGRHAARAPTSSSALVATLPERRVDERGSTPTRSPRRSTRRRCLVLPSRREGMGRVVVEAFCRGRAVVGARGGGIADLVATSENGLLVPSGDTGRARRRARARLLDDSRALASSGSRAGREAASRDSAGVATPRGATRAQCARWSTRSGNARVKLPRIACFVARTRYRLPLVRSATRASSPALERVAELRVLASGGRRVAPDDGTFHLVGRPAAGSTGRVFISRCRCASRASSRAFEPDVRSCTASPYEAASARRRLAASDARIVVDLHGDWRTSARLYGSPAAPRCSRRSSTCREVGVRRADGSADDLRVHDRPRARAKASSPSRSSPRSSTLELFRDRPPAPLPPRAPRVLFVGVLEHYKGVDGARRGVAAAPRLPGRASCGSSARGKPDVVEELARRPPAQTSVDASGSTRRARRGARRSTVPRPAVASEGLPRIVLESFCRGRAVVAARAGGIRRHRRDGENGLLVDPDDAAALADALVERAPRARLGRALAAGPRARRRWLATPEEFAERRPRASSRSLDWSRARRAGKQLLKNGVYRTIGETTDARRSTARRRGLRVLMYHKVNDLPENPLSVPVGAFDDQLAQLRELGYTVVTSTPCSPTTATGPAPGARRADHLRRRLPRQPRARAPVLQKHGYPAVIFVPIGYLDGARPLPHEEQRAARGAVNSTVDWGELRELEAAGVRVESHGIPTGRSPTSRSTRPRARSSSRSCGSRSGSAARCARSRTSRAPRRTTRRCT